MTESEALLQAIIENPDADLPRLVYADWIEEHGSDSERAEFIRVQIELPNRGPDFLKQYDREWELIEQKTNEWFPDFEITNNPEWFDEPHCEGNKPEQWALLCRGFLDRVACTMSYWVEHGPKLIREHPIQIVMITDKRTWNVGREFTWFDDGDIVDATDGLPECIYYFLEGYTSRGGNYEWKAYKTEEEADSAFSTACLKWAKQQKDKTND